jgi:hypothetical protein
VKVSEVDLEAAFRAALATHGNYQTGNSWAAMRRDELRVALQAGIEALPDPQPGPMPDRVDVAQALSPPFYGHLRFDELDKIDTAALLDAADRAIRLCAGKLPAEVWSVLQEMRACDSDGIELFAVTAYADKLEAALRSVHGADRVAELEAKLAAVTEGRDRLLIGVPEVRYEGLAACPRCVTLKRERDEALAKLAAADRLVKSQDELLNSQAGIATSLRAEMECHKAAVVELRDQLAARPEPVVIDDGLVCGLLSRMQVMSGREAIRRVFGDRASVTVPQGDGPCPVYVAQLQEAAGVLSRIELAWCIEGDYAPDDPDDKRHPIERRLAGMQAMHSADVAKLRAEIERVRGLLAEADQFGERISKQMVATETHLRAELEKTRAERDDYARLLDRERERHVRLHEQHEALRSTLDVHISAMEEDGVPSSVALEYQSGFGAACRSYGKRLRALLRPATPEPRNNAPWFMPGGETVLHPPHEAAMVEHTQESLGRGAPRFAPIYAKLDETAARVERLERFVNDVHMACDYPNAVEQIRRAAETALDARSKT